MQRKYAEKHTEMTTFLQSCPRVFLALPWAMWFWVILNMFPINSISLPVSPLTPSLVCWGFISFCHLCNEYCHLHRAYFYLAIALSPWIFWKHHVITIKVIKSIIWQLSMSSLPQWICPQGWLVFLLWLYLIN